MPLDTRNMVCMSMAHIKPNTYRKLLITPLAEWPFMGAPVGTDMILCYAHSENCGGAGDEIPGSVWDCIVLARAAGFDYIMFDRDVGADEDGFDLPDFSEEGRTEIEKEWADPVAICRDAIEIIEAQVPARTRRGDEVLRDLLDRCRAVTVIEPDYKPGDIIPTVDASAYDQAAKVYSDAVHDQPTDLRDTGAFRAWTDRVDTARAAFEAVASAAASGIA